MNEQEIIDKLEDIQLDLSRMKERHAQEVELVELALSELRRGMNKEIDNRLEQSAKDQEEMAAGKEDEEREMSRIVEKTIEDIHEERERLESHSA